MANIEDDLEACQPGSKLLVRSSKLIFAGNAKWIKSRSDKISSGCLSWERVNSLSRTSKRMEGMLEFISDISCGEL